MTAVAYLWAPKGSFPWAVSRRAEAGQRRGCVDATHNRLFSVQTHCSPSRVFVRCVCLCLLSGLISTAEFRDSSSSERESRRVSKIWTSKREDGGSADRAVFYNETSNQERVEGKLALRVGSLFRDIIYKSVYYKINCIGLCLLLN